MFALGGAIFNLCLKLLFGRNSLYKGVKINTFFFSGILRLKLRRFGRKIILWGQAIQYNVVSALAHARLAHGPHYHTLLCNDQIDCYYVKRTF